MHEAKEVFGQSELRVVKRRIAALTFTIVVVTAALTGCAPVLNPETGQPMGTNTTNTASVVRPGTVVQSSATKVRKTSSVAWWLSSGLISPGTTPGERILVQITGGPKMSVLQAGTTPVFTPGEQVVVIQKGSVYHVEPATGQYAPAPTTTNSN